MGAKATGGGNWDGTIDEPAVYDSALSPATIYDHYQAGKIGIPDTVAPAKPATPTATAGNTTASINLATLNTEPDLASYSLQRKLTSAADSTYATVKTGITAFPATDTGLTNGTSYSYRVIAVDTSGNASAPSDSVSVTPLAIDVTPPAKPATPTAVPGNRQATISLSPLNGESDLASYTLQRKLTSAADSTYAAIKTGVATWPQVDTAVANGTSYSYRVLAIDTLGNVSTPSDSVVVVPSAPTYLATIDSTSGLSGYWRFGELSGLTAYARTGIVNGTYGAGTSLAQISLLNGDNNASISLAGSASISFGDAFDFAGGTPFSLEAWVKPSAVDDISRRIFSKETTDASGVQGYYLLSNTTRLSFGLLRDDSYNTLTGPALVAGQRYHIVVTYTGAQMSLYVNGTLVNTTPAANILKDTPATFMIGAKTGGGGTFLGQIDEPAVYSAALSPNTITNHYVMGTTGAAPSDIVPPAKPATPTATAGNTTASINLATLNTEPDLASYSLQRKLTSAADSTYATVKTGITAFPATDTGLTNDTSYTYRLLAVDTSGNASTPSDSVAVTPFAPDVTSPAKPATPTAVAGNRQATIKPGAAEQRVRPGHLHASAQGDLGRGHDVRGDQDRRHDLAADRHDRRQRHVVLLPRAGDRQGRQRLDAVRLGGGRPVRAQLRGDDRLDLRSQRLLALRRGLGPDGLRPHRHRQRHLRRWHHARPAEPDHHRRQHGHRPRRRGRQGDLRRHVRLRRTSRRSASRPGSSRASSTPRRAGSSARSPRTPTAPRATTCSRTRRA